MSRRSGYLIFFFILAVIAFCVWYGLHTFSSDPVTIEEYAQVSAPPKIKPDYSGIVIPPNIGPLNFVIHEPGTGYYVKAYSAEGTPLKVYSKTGRIEFSRRKWQKLLSVNPGKKLYIDIYVKSKGNGWVRHENIVNTIAEEPIDPYVAYRIINPLYNFTNNTAIHQYDLENNKESLIIKGKSFYSGCVNCHSFLNYDPETMLLGFRNIVYGMSTLFASNGRVKKLGIKFGHTSWHPSGKVAAYSIYRVKQFFHHARREVRDVVELDSALAYYLLDKQVAKTTPEFADKERLETQPVWSPDGKYLYFVSAPVLWENRKKLPPENFEKVQYDLMRISYDVETDTWGKLETFLSAEQTGKSILIPRFSPDGRFMLVSMCDYSCFALFQPSSDLYLIDMETGKYSDLEEANSNHSEAWHGFSSNSRWIVFSSKRPEGVFTRLYFSYIDKTGKSSKAFIMPQSDASFYESSYRIYNVPEFISGPVKISQKEFGRAIRSKDEVKVEIPFSTATPQAPGETLQLERE